MIIISATVDKNPLEEVEKPSQATKESWCSTWYSTWCSLKNDRMILVHFQGKPFNMAVIRVQAPITNAKETNTDQFYEDLQDLLERTPTKDVLFITWDQNAKVGSQEIPGIIGKFGLEVQNKATQRLSIVKRTHWSQQTQFSNRTRDKSTHGHHQMVNTEIRLIILFASEDGKALQSQQKQDFQLTMAQIMRSLLQNSGLN